MWAVSPEMSDPDCVIELETITAMKSGSGPAGGEELLPGSLLQFTPHAGTAGSGANPLNAAGAAPPLRGFSFDHCAPQNVTAVLTALFWSPITNAPPPGAKAKISVRHVCDVVLPPTSLTVVVTL